MSAEAVKILADVYEEWGWITPARLMRQNHAVSVGERMAIRAIERALATPATSTPEAQPGQGPDVAALVERFEKAIRDREFRRPKGPRSGDHAYYDQLCRKATAARAALFDALTTSTTAPAMNREAIARALFEHDNPEVEWGDWLSYCADHPAVPSHADEYRSRADAIIALTKLPAPLDRGWQQDAERFRALMRCGRIKMQGSAGVDPQTGERLYPERPGSVHFGAEFWPKPATDPETGQVKVYEDCPRDMTTWGHHALRALADDILAVEAAAPPVSQQSEGGKP